MAWRKGTATDFIDFITKVKTFATKEMFAGAVTPDGGNAGDGIVYGASGTEDSVAETWTLTCTIGGGNGTAVFSVEGSVSGAKADATAGTPYGIDEVSFTILSGGTDFEVDDEFSFDVEAGDAEYEMVRERDTNDYLTGAQWAVLGSEDCARQTTQKTSTLGLVAPSAVLESDFSFAFWHFSTGSTGTKGSPKRAISGAYTDTVSANKPFITLGQVDTSYVLSRGYSSNSLVVEFGSVAINTWTHIALVVDRDTNILVYINGSLVYTWEQTSTGMSLANLCFVSRAVFRQAFNMGPTIYPPAMNGLRDIQVYYKALSGAEVTDIYGGTPASDIVHHWLCDEGEGSRYAVDSVGGSAYNFDLGPTKRELILKGEGSNGTAEIYTGLQSYTNAVDRWNVKLSGFTGFVGSNTFDTQPGATDTPPAMLLQNTSFNYLIHTTPNRIFLFAQAGGNDESGYMGWYIPYFSEDQWGYPIAVGGSSADSTLAPNDTTTDHKAWFSLSEALQILVNGAWAAVNTADPYSTNGFAGTDHLQDAAGNYPDFDFIPFSTTDSLYFGPFEGVRIPVQANTIQSGDVLVDTTAAKLVIGDTFRVGQGTVAAIDLSGD